MLNTSLQPMIGAPARTTRLVSHTALTACLTYAEAVARLEAPQSLINDVRIYPDVVAPAKHICVAAIKRRVRDLLASIDGVATADALRMCLVDSFDDFDDWSKTTDQLTAAYYLASFAMELEEVLLASDLPFEVELELAQLVACLTDHVTIMVRASRYDGYCTSLCAFEWDPRQIARGLARLGILPQRDPRAMLSYATYGEFHDFDVVGEFGALVAQAELATQAAVVIAGSPYSRSELIDELHAALEHLTGSDESADGAGIFTSLARVYEGIGMNLHLDARASRKDSDEYLALAAIIARTAFRLRRDIALETAGRQPLGPDTTLLSAA